MTLGDTISLIQGDFVKGCQILDGALAANEVVEKYQTMRKGGYHFQS